MNATPMIMPRRRPVRAESSRRYSTSTGDLPLPVPVPSDTGVLGYEDDPHCFVCGRHTDHGSEHDALVEAGLATYDADGSVRRTAQWDRTRATQIADAEYQRYVADRLAGH